MVAIEVNRRSDETPLAYHKRLVYGKLVDKTLADVDYTELAELAYGKAYSSDVARRMFYGSKRTLDLIEDEQLDALSGEGLMSEMDDRVAELQKERQKFKDQRREYNKLLSNEAREENLYDVLERAAENLQNTVGSVYENHTASRHTTDEDTEGVLVYSDWHYGLKTENVFNQFDTEICKERVAHVTEEAIKRLQLHHCGKLHVVVLGDLFHGAIHTSARVASEELVCDQMMQATEILAQSIKLLSRYVDEVFVYTTYGNHARTVQNKKDNIHRDNMERLVPWWLKERFSDDENITIVPDSGSEFLFIEAAGHEICAAHGDNDSVKKSTRVLPTLFRKTQGRDIEYILLGDKHHRESFEEFGVSALLCGALCGTDDYANTHRLYCDPSQLLLIVNKQDGVDAEYRIKC